MATTIVDREVEVQDGMSSHNMPSVLQVVWQRKSLVILGLVLGLVLGTLYYAQQQPVFQSNAKILIVKKSPDNVMQMSGPNGMQAYMEDYLATHVELIKSTEIIGRAARSPELKDLTSFPDQSDLTGAIMAGLTVGRGRDSQGQMNNILVLSFRGPVPDDCQKVIEVVIAKYQDFLNETYKDVSDQTLHLISQARDSLQTDLTKTEREYANYKASSPAAMMMIEGGRSVYADRLSRIENRRSEIKINQLVLTSRLSMIEKNLKEFGKDAALRAINANSNKPILTGNQGLDAQLAPMMLEREKLLRSGCGPYHPQVISIDNAIDYTKKLYQGKLSNERPKMPADGETLREADGVEVYLQQLKADVADNITQMQELDTMFETASKEAREMNKYQAEEDRLKSLRDTSKEILSTIVKRLQEISLTRGSGGYFARPIEHAGIGYKVAPKPYVIFSLAAVLGLLAGTGLAYLAEISDKSFRTPAEIRRRLGLPVIGHIPFIGADHKAAEVVAGGTSVLDPMLCTHYASNSVESEAYRGVRTALYFNTHGAGHQVIQVTSPNASDGKSTLAANLAVSIAQSGKRTLLIDCDFRKPRAHKIFGVPGGVGMASVIAGQATLDEGIQTSIIPGLSILPCGPRPANPAELLTSPRFKEVLDAIRTQYDFVILDSPPLLVVTDPSVVAPRVDGVVLCIRVTKNGRPHAERAKEVLAALGANVLGVVVNGFGTQADGSRYGYEHYSIGYGEGYGYGYGYTYGDASYYADPVEEIAAPPVSVNGKGPGPVA